MTSKIYLIRHAESVHNVSKDFSHRDPPLTELGQSQASALTQSFPGLSSVAVVISSPLARTLQTTLAAFSSVLEKQYIGEAGIEAGASLILDPNLQERSDLACDTGSDRKLLEAQFPGLDLSGLQDGWFAKTGKFAPDDASVQARAAVVRNRLYEIVTNLQEISKPGQRRDVAAVTHGVFMKFLADDQAIDLPKAGWKEYTIEKSDDDSVILRAL
ncbi:phosphoglycerate mutase family protein [Paramyrothecium foliicola]|nr:phosphoglycerate mutase family protein [Paramyrothecium foliicola]